MRYLVDFLDDNSPSSPEVDRREAGVDGVVVHHNHTVVEGGRRTYKLHPNVHCNVGLRYDGRRQPLIRPCIATKALLLPTQRTAYTVHHPTYCTHMLKLGGVPKPAVLATR